MKKLMLLICIVITNYNNTDNENYLDSYSLNHSTHHHTGENYIPCNCERDEIYYHKNKNQRQFHRQNAHANNREHNEHKALLGTVLGGGVGAGIGAAAGGGKGALIGGPVGAVGGFFISKLVS